ncbi:collagen-like protein [Streptomyces sp. NPDC006129]|uniref:collagen-like triple helix repeat-containing protein n=1 Tax=Streptomyces sp. NPDC006129 TaxID=3155348 RepID=UPI0033B5EB72
MLPDGIPTVRVTGRFLTPAGEPLAGQVVFRAPGMVTFPDSDVILGGPVTAPLDATGAFAVTLPATDAPDMNPTGWSYSVAEQLAGVAMNRVYQVLLPADDPEVDLADIAPTDPTTPTYVAVRGDSAYEVAVKAGFVGTVAQWLASLVGPQGVKGDTGATGPAGPQGVKGDTGAQGPAGAPGVVQSVNGQSAAAVVLAAADVGAVAATNGKVSGTFTLDGTAGTFRPIKLQTAGVDRWQLQTDGTAEGGTDTGSNLRITPRHDDGTDNGVALFIRRDNRRVVINGTSTAGESVLTATGAIGAKDIAADPATSAGSIQLYSKAGLPYIKQGDGTVFQVGTGGTAPVTSVNTKTGAVVLNAADVGALATTARGAASGVASLDASTRIPITQMPTAVAKNTWTPQALGFQAWACDPYGVANPAAKYLTPQRLYLTGVNITESTTVTKAVMFARGYGGVSTNRYMAGIYREDGTRVVASSAVALTMAGQEAGALPAMASNHIGAVPLSFASTTLAPGRYWVAWLMTVGGTADFSFFHVQNEAPVATANFFMTTTPFPRAWYIAGQSTLPTTVSPTASTALADHDIPIVALAA